MENNLSKLHYNYEKKTGSISLPAGSKEIKSQSNFILYEVLRFYKTLLLLSSVEEKSDILEKTINLICYARYL